MGGWVRARAWVEELLLLLVVVVDLEQCAALCRLAACEAGKRGWEGWAKTQPIAHLLAGSQAIQLASRPPTEALISTQPPSHLHF